MTNTTVEMINSACRDKQRNRTRRCPVAVEVPFEDVKAAIWCNVDRHVLCLEMRDVKIVIRTLRMKMLPVIRDQTG
jgi:hypothetical protein